MNCTVRFASIWGLGCYKCRPLTGTFIPTPISVDPQGAPSFQGGGTIWIITIKIWRVLFFPSMFHWHCLDLIATQFRRLTWDKWKLKCCFTGLRSVVLCSQQFFIGCDRCLLLLPAVERLLFLPACSHPLTEVITEEASDRSVLVLGENSSLALNFIFGLSYFGRLFLQWVNRWLNIVLGHISVGQWELKSWEHLPLVQLDTEDFSS